ncbi:MAG: hypothetical protein LUQ11_01690 [Methylococcaceae bacterium]|nr:hypothetical protein [Methylococcaceae bacterium]
MTEDEAKLRAIKETDYCYVLARAWEGKANDSICLERIFTKGGCEEIRLAWWKDGKQTMRPADINSPDWVPLFQKAIKQGVFTAEEQLGMLKSLIQ